MYYVFCILYYVLSLPSLLLSRTLPLPRTQSNPIPSDVLLPNIRLPAYVDVSNLEVALTVY